MTDAPERIWAWVDYDGSWDGKWLADSVALQPERLPDAEYIRADLVPGWSSDMDAAPKDGTRVLAYWPDVHGTASAQRVAAQVESWFGPRQGEWEDACWQSAFEWDDGSNSPTHWRPLPAPPEEGE